MASVYDDVYRSVPNWDVGHPQPAFVWLEEEGLLGERIIDVGCGTGELALYLTNRGHRVLGIDFSTEAIARAKAKARWRRIDAHFLVMDALDLDRLQVTVDSVVDSAMFHVLGNAERDRFVDVLATVLPRGGRYFTLCDERPDGTPIGAYGISREELSERFNEHRGWHVDFVYRSGYERRWSTSPALLAGITRTA